MNIALCSYADISMTISQEKLSRSFEKFCSVKYYNGTWDFGPGHIQIDNRFLHFNHDILKQERGSGYWLWKPYFIYQSLEYLKEGDYLLYVDAGVEIIKNIQPLIDLGEDITLFHNEWPHIDWCKWDVLKAMLSGNGSVDYATSKQVQASVILIKKTKHTVDFVREWLVWCQLPGFIDDSPSKLENISTFQQHRHDQAILTNLALRENIKLHSWDKISCTEGNRASRPEAIFFHHYKRDPGMGNGRPEW